MVEQEPFKLLVTGSNPVRLTASNAVSLETVCRRVSRLTRLPLNNIMDETSDVSSLKARYYVYILFSFKDKGLYIGFTTELKNRLIHHASGKVTATKLRRPLKLIHYEYFINKEDAKAREEFLKSGYGRKQLKEFLKRTLSELKKKH